MQQLESIANFVVLECIIFYVLILAFQVSNTVQIFGVQIFPIPLYS